MTTTTEAIRAAATAVGPTVVGLGRGPRAWTGLVVAPDRVLTTSFRLRRRRDPNGPVTVTLAGGERADGRVLASDDRYGIALLDAATGGSPVARIEFDAVVLGSALVALANPGGQGLRATLGHVTTDPRPSRGRLRGTTIEHTAPLGHGSGGGPIVDSEGRAVGMNLARLEGGIVLALAFDAAAREILAAMLAGEHSAPPRLGVAIAPPRAARRMRSAVGLPPRDGLLVRHVEAGSLAERAEIRPGDLIATIDGVAIDGVGDVEGALERHASGATLRLGLVRGAEDVVATLTSEASG